MEYQHMKWKLYKKKKNFIIQSKLYIEILYYFIEKKYAWYIIILFRHINILIKKIRVVTCNLEQ